MSFTLAMPVPDHGLRPGDVVLTGDRPTGALHLGHLCGSLATRVAGQHVCPHAVLVADLQALTDHAHDPAKVRSATLEVVKDYLAVGLDPDAVHVILQSAVPELAELTMLLSMVVSEERAFRNPTVKAEIGSKSFKGGVPLAFAMYPVSQCADILGFGATAVPVGDDQRPMLDLAREMARRLNGMGGVAMPVPRGVYPAGPSGRLPGVDGRKASKTLGNAVPLSSGRAEIERLVRRMVSDPGRKGPEDPGDPDVTVTFAYLRAFDPDREELADLERRYREGGVRDGDVKARVVSVLDRLLTPVRTRRAQVDDGTALAVISSGTVRARPVVRKVLDGCRSRFGLRDLARMD